MPLRRGTLEGGDRMAVQTGTGARLIRAWHGLRPHSRRNRRSRQIGPLVEGLEARLVLAGVAPANPALVRPDSVANPNPGPSGLAFQQVVESQTTTLQSLGDSVREVQAAGSQFAHSADVAIASLKAELSQSPSRHDTHAINSAIRRDRDLVGLGEAAATHETKGLDVDRGLEDSEAASAEVDIVNGAFTKLSALVQPDQSTGTDISRSAKRSTNAIVSEIDKLGDQLISTVPA
jgi:hypothetical protein